MSQMKMITDAQLEAIRQAFLAELEKPLHQIGTIVSQDAKQAVLDKGIKDKGDFYRNLDYLVVKRAAGLGVVVGSRVRHEPYVLGGKVPSWAPFKKLKSWVERKNLNWTDRKTGKELTVDQMAGMIQSKIRREGIKARNIYIDILKKRENWIMNLLDNLEVTI